MPSCTNYLLKAVNVELANKRGKVVVLKVCGQDLCAERCGVMDDKGEASLALKEFIKQSKIVKSDLKTTEKKQK
jgi:hypothetical protein